MDLPAAAVPPTAFKSPGMEYPGRKLSRHTNCYRTWVNNSIGNNLATVADKKSMAMEVVVSMALSVDMVEEATAVAGVPMVDTDKVTIVMSDTMDMSKEAMAAVSDPMDTDKVTIVVSDPMDMSKEATAVACGIMDKAIAGAIAGAIAEPMEVAMEGGTEKAMAEVMGGEVMDINSAMPLVDDVYE